MYFDLVRENEVAPSICRSAAVAVKVLVMLAMRM